MLRSCVEKILFDILCYFYVKRIIIELNLSISYLHFFIQVDEDTQKMIRFKLIRLNFRIIEEK